MSLANILVRILAFNWPLITGLDFSFKNKNIRQYIKGTHWKIHSRCEIRSKLRPIVDFSLAFLRLLMSRESFIYQSKFEDFGIFSTLHLAKLIFCFSFLRVSILLFLQFIYLLHFLAKRTFLFVYVIIDSRIIWYH